MILIKENYRKIKSIIVVIPKTTPQIIVILSKFFSTIPEPSKVSIIPENNPETPPPFPECNRISNITPKLAII
jgi:hypothetical protein